MKKFLMSCFSLVLAVTVVFSFTACKTKLSKTTTDTTNVKAVNGVSTNGGITVVHGDYLYFINGTKTNDGKSQSKNKRSAICRVKYNVATGEVDANSYEVVVDSLVGFEDGSLYFFGDFMYYATPCAEKNYLGEVLFNKTVFMRYDLVNKKSYTLFTTALNDEKEVVSYAYYVVGTELCLVVYETNNATITSLKINDEVTTNYVVSDVTSCVLSENNGICTTAGKTIDANSYVYYTVSHDLYEPIQTGVKVVRISPISNTSKVISDEGLDVSLLCIRAGKLLYSTNDIVYASQITGAENEKLSFAFSNVVSYQTYENVIFMENKDGSISVLSYNTETYQIVVCRWVNGVEIENNTINVLSKSEAFEFVTLATIDEVVVEDNEATTDVDETETEKVQYLIYIDSGSLNKLEIAREVKNGQTSEMKLSKYSQPIKLTLTKVEASNGLLVAEAVGNFMFVFAQDDKKNVYMHKVDLTITDNSTKSAKIVAVVE